MAWYKDIDPVSVGITEVSFTCAKPASFISDGGIPSAFGCVLSQPSTFWTILNRLRIHLVRYRPKSATCSAPPGLSAEYIEDKPARFSASGT